MWIDTVPIIYSGYAAFTCAIMADAVPSIDGLPIPTTITGALAIGFIAMLGALVFVVKKQLESFPNALEKQQATFTTALSTQNMIFATVIDKIREDHQKTMDKMIEVLKDGQK